MARPRRRQQAAPPKRLILDSGAVIALARNDLRARATLAAAWEVRADVLIPSIVVAETVRGAAKDASVNRVIKAVGEVTVADESVGRIAGRLLGQACSNQTVDAVVAATAVALGGAMILTGDFDDLQLLASENPEVVVRAL